MSSSWRRSDGGNHVWPPCFENIPRAIRRGSTARGAWPQHRAAAFLSEADTLIISPGLFERGPLRHPGDIVNHVLLSSQTRPGDWTDWLERAGLPHRPEQRRRVFDRFFVRLQAVVGGLGIAIGPLPVPQTDVAAGRLLTPLPAIRVQRTGYVALVPFDASKTSALTSFLDWPVAEGSA
jgi:LysR family transcriptional regulator, glycine cleavage system transcriptional activator